MVVARLNVDGSLDSGFNIGSGFDGPINSIAVTGVPMEIDQTESGGPAEEHFPIDTGSKSGTIRINYDFGLSPDAMRIYYGGVNGGTVIYNSGIVASNGPIHTQALKVTEAVLGETSSLKPD